jgi:hypothetical protein
MSNTNTTQCVIKNVQQAINMALYAGKNFQDWNVEIITWQPPQYRFDFESHHELTLALLNS